MNQSATNPASPASPAAPPADAVQRPGATGPLPERLPSILNRLAILVVACVLPAALVSAYLIYDHYQVERSVLLNEALSTTRSMVTVVDRDFDTVTTALRTLSSSNDIEQDLAEFKSQAMNVHAILPITDIALVDPDSGMQLMNTVASAGAAPRMSADRKLIARLRRNGQPAVSDLYLAGKGEAPFITIGVPVFRGGMVTHALTARVEPGTLATILKDQRLPDSWRVAIIDPKGVLVARNYDMQQYVGKPVNPDLVAHLGKADHGSFDTRTLDGIPVVTVYSRSPRSGWTVALGVPQRSLSAGLLRTLESLILATVVLLTIGLGLAWLVGRRIVRSIQALIEPATALGTGGLVKMPRLDFKEAAQVANSLLRASHTLFQAKQAAASEMSERQAAQAALMAADTRKDEFLATLAHELRNPMAPLVNALEILRMSEERRASSKNVLDIMERQLKQMVRLIDDLLDVSRITTNKLSIKNDALTLQEVIAYSQETAGIFIEKRGHRLLVSLPPLPVPLRGDATRLAQVFSNLLNNAAKYTPPGGHITLSAIILGQRVQVAISDSGIGIAQPVLARVFDIFFQVDQSLGRSQSGLGIGLPLARRLVELHGGTLRASSAGVDQGSTFTVELPIAQPDPASLARPAADTTAAPSADAEPEQQVSRAGDGRVADLPVHRVLLADDNVDHANTLTELLAASGQQIQVCYDGTGALQAADAFLPQFAFLDIGMPGLDGYELAARLRANPATAGCVLVAVTGWGQEKDQLRSRQAGFDFHIVKPVRLAQLHEILALSGRPDRAAPRPD